MFVEITSFEKFYTLQTMKDIQHQCQNLDTEQSQFPRQYPDRTVGYKHVRLSVKKNQLLHNHHYIILTVVT